MDVINTILGRRSIRQGFTGGPLGVENVRRIIECGLAAPSSKDAQPWRFHLVEDATMRNTVASAMCQSDRLGSYVPTDPTTGLPHEAYESSVIESARALAEASCAVFVENESPFTGGRARLLSDPASFDEAIVGYSFELLGIGAAIENMLVAAHALGIGSVFVGDVLIIEDVVRSLLRIEGDLVGVIALGWTTAAPWRERRIHDLRVVEHGPLEPAARVR